MQNLHLPTSQLYFQICLLSRSKRITDIERRALKKLVIIDDQQIFDLIDAYNQKRINEIQLQEQLIAHSKDVDMKSDTNEEAAPQQDSEFNQQEAQKVADFIQQNPQIPDEIASPLGAQLWRKRRLERQQKTKK